MRDYHSRTSEEILELFETRNRHSGKDSVDESVAERVRELSNILFNHKEMAKMNKSRCQYLLSEGKTFDFYQLLDEGETEKVLTFIRNTVSTPHTIDMRALGYSHDLIERAIDYMRFIKLYKLGLIGIPPQGSSLFPDDADREKKSYNYNNTDMRSFLDHFEVDLNVY